MKFKTSEIIFAIKKGDDTKVLTFLYEKLLPEIKFFVLKNKGTEDEAYDVFQDAIMVFYKYVKQNKYDKTKNVHGFIYSVSKNIWLNKLKKEQRKTHLFDLNDKDSGIDIMQDIITNEREEMIKKLFTDLGERCKELLIYTFFNDYSMVKISELMGFATVNAVKTKRYKCKQRLIELINSNKQYEIIFKHK